MLSGLTVEELGEGGDRGEVIRRELVRLGAPQRPVDAEGGEADAGGDRANGPFTRKDWLFEPKLDGYRVLAARSEGEPRLLTRNGNDCAAGFPEVVRAVAALPFDRLVLDGEVVALDDAGRPSFQRLQGRARLSRPIDIRHAAVNIPVTYYAFDLLGFEDFDLRPLPLTARKAILRRVLPPVGALRFLEHVEEEGEALYQEASGSASRGSSPRRRARPTRRAARRCGSRCAPGRPATSWWSASPRPRDARGGFGALQLGEYVDGTLTYAGRAGSGFSDKQLGEVRQKLEAQKRRDPPCVGPIQGDKDDHLGGAGDGVRRWSTPSGPTRGCCGSRCSSGSGTTRRPEECVRRDGGRAASEPHPERSEGPAPRTGAGGQSRSRSLPRDEAAPRSPAGELPFELTNLKKVFWPEEGYTKGDLIEYYRAVSPWLLAYLRNRPVVMTRYPDGINGKSFFQKDAPGFRPDWIRTERMWSEDTQREIDYFVCDDEASLLYVVNLGTIPLHLWASRAPTLERPDWCVLDLDPKGAPFEHVVELARAAKELCDRIELPVMVKSTGSSGLHLMIPLGRQCTHEQSRSLGELLARCLVDSLPEIATIVRQVHRRDGQGVRGLPPERLGQAHRGAVQRAAAARRTGLGAARLAGGEPAARHPEAHHPDGARSACGS